MYHLLLGQWMPKDCLYEKGEYYYYRYYCLLDSVLIFYARHDLSSCQRGSFLFFKMNNNGDNNSHFVYPIMWKQLADMCTSIIVVGFYLLSAVYNCYGVYEVETSSSYYYYRPTYSHHTTTRILCCPGVFNSLVIAWKCSAALSPPFWHMVDQRRH